MKYSKLIILIILIKIIASCSHSYYGPQPRIETKVIPLHFEPNQNYISYENKKAIIIIEKDKAIALIKNRLKSKHLCEQRRLKYNNLLNTMIESPKQNMYYIEPTIDYNEVNAILPIMDTTYGFSPLDFYARSVKNDLSLHFIEPYGYLSQSADTLNAVKIKIIYDWVITDLLLKGFGKVLNKYTGNYETNLLYNIYLTGDGHGGESLLFQDKSLFFNLATFSDIIEPDYECMDSIELKQYWGE
jgi:hypothetical protein